MSIRKKYTRSSDGNLHPMLKANIYWKDRSQPLTFLLDSGATFTFVNKRYLELLSTSTQEMECRFSRLVASAFGAMQIASFYDMRFNIEGREITLPVAFHEASWNLLGRIPAFECFSPIVLIEHENEKRCILECRGMNYGEKNNI